MSLSITYATLRREIGRFLGYDRDPSNWSADQIADVADILASGLRSFYFPPGHSWSFLRPTATLSLTVGDGDYDLPTNFGGLVTGFSYAAAAGEVSITATSEEKIRALRSAAAQEGAPKYYAIRVKTQVADSAELHEALFYPTPDDSYTVTYRYSLEPATLSASNTVPLGGARHSEAILEACLAAAEKTLNDEAGVHHQKFADLLQASIALDTAAISVDGDVWPLENPASDLTINKAYLKRLVGRELGYGPNPAVWSHHQGQEVELAVQTGLRRFYSPPVLPGERYSHEWSFLRPAATLTLTADDYQYDLPADFAMLTGPLTFAPGAAVLYPPVQIVGEHQIRQRLQRSEASARPSMAAIRVKDPDDTVGTRYEILLWPVPDDAYDLTYRYHINPDTLDSDTALPFGGQPNAQTVIEACLAAAEDLQGEPGLHSEAFMERLQASVGHDRKVSAADTLGFNRDPSDFPMDPFANFHDFDENIVTYTGYTP